MLTKVEELEDYSRRALVNFPKAERHLLTAEVRLCIDRIERLTLTAWKRYQKKTTLTDLDIEIEVLRRKVRKAQRYGHISGGQYRDWAQHINDLGAILGGWLRHEREEKRLDVSPSYFACSIADAVDRQVRIVLPYLRSHFA
jgi:hypothetical protein